MSLIPLASVSRSGILSTGSRRAACALLAANHASSRTGYAYSARFFSVSRFSQETIKELKKEDGTSKVGTEGLHKHDLPGSSSAAPKAVVTPAGKASSTSSLESSLLTLQREGDAATSGLVDAPLHHQGDWVLFHPVYTKEELNSVQVLRHERKTAGDKVAAGFVAALRKGFDIISGYTHKPLPPNHASMSVAELRKEGYIMDEGQWLMRILFLETIAGVPGFMAAMVRHLKSLRIMKRDGGWIHMLLEEAENERMHLLTFMTLKKPSIWFRGLILGAQGVFANAFFLTYLFSPKICHRFVGVLEEEATYTYTLLINDIESGKFPEWDNKPAPPIAIDYWRLPKDATLLDVIYAVRSDESTHRFVNHTLANLNPKEDINPFALGEPNMLIKGTKSGFSREEAAEYMKKNRTRAEDALNAATQAGSLDGVVKTGSAPTTPSA